MAEQAESNAQHRGRALRRAGIGIALFLPGLVLFVVARAWLLETFGTRVGDEVTVRMPRIVALFIGGPMAAGYAMLMMGLYGAIFGARGRAMTAAWSAFRILFGLVVTLGMVVVAIVLLGLLRG